MFPQRIEATKLDLKLATSLCWLFSFTPQKKPIYPEPRSNQQSKYSHCTARHLPRNVMGFCSYWTGSQAPLSTGILPFVYVSLTHSLLRMLFSVHLFLCYFKIVYGILFKYFHNYKFLFLLEISTGSSAYVS